MSMPSRATAWWLAGSLLACGGSALALDEGATDSGRHYASGGVSDDELAGLQSRRGDFSLWVITAARKTGAYLSDVRVQITDEQHRVVFDRPLAGPWLLIDLPLGRYEVRAQLDGQTQTHTTTIHPGDHHQATFYFDVDADVLPPAQRTLR